MDWQAACHGVIDAARGQPAHSFPGFFPPVGSIPDALALENSPSVPEDIGRQASETIKFSAKGAFSQDLALHRGSPVITFVA